MNLSESYVKRNPDCAFRVIDDQALIVRVSSGEGNRVFSLNPTGAVIWELADGHTSLAEIAARVDERFEVGDRPQVESDVLEFVDGLVARDLLAKSEEPF